MAITTELPTTTKLGISISDVTAANAEQVATEWLNSFSQALTQADFSRIFSLMTHDAWWRDILALTWDYRSFQGQDKIEQFLQDRLSSTKPSNFKLTLAEAEEIYEDLAWVRTHYTFETDVGHGSGIVRLIPVRSQDGQLAWKAHAILTNLESLKGFPEATGQHRNFAPNHGKWLEQRRREVEFLDNDPEVLVIGGGQSGLGIAARLKVLGVQTLLCEKLPRIGDIWRQRYVNLSLNNVVCECTRCIPWRSQCSRERRV